MFKKINILRLSFTMFFYSRDVCVILKKQLFIVFFAFAATAAAASVVVAYLALL